MTDQELIAALRWNMMETGSIICLGCGHEHGCSTHGCAVLREAAERIAQLGEQHSCQMRRCFWFQDEVCCCADSDWFAEFPPADCRCKSGKRKDADHEK